MPRKPRIEFTGAFYHVITRGNQRQRIFNNPSDFQKYLQVLSTYKNRYGYVLYAYVLMSNHVHLLLETKEAPLSKIFQGINQSYTMYFNRRYQTVGHLFQGRYKAILCDRDKYLLALLKYIHLNSVRAKVVEVPGRYPWSSHHAYLGKKDLYGLIETNQVLGMFSDKRTQACKQYRVFMSEGQVIDKEDVYGTVDQRLQGDEEFVGWVLRKYDGDLKAVRRKKKYALAEISPAIEERYGVMLAELRSASKERRIMEGRRIFSCVAAEFGYLGKELAHYLRKDPSSITGYRRGGDMDSAVEEVIRILKKKECQ